MGKKRGQGDPASALEKIDATLGEIIDVMRDVFGSYEEPDWI